MTTEQDKENPWEGYNPNAPVKEETPEQRVRALEQWVWEIQQAQKGIPRSLILKQGAALVFVVVNAALMYANMNSGVAVYIALYMVPLTLLLLDYFMVIRELKLIAAGKKK